MFFADTSGDWSPANCKAELCFVSTHFPNLLGSCNQFVRFMVKVSNDFSHFPITELLDETESLAWVEKSFHPKGLNCPGCGATREHARAFRKHKRGVVDYRCANCQRP
jgi:hypothetical protein